MKMTKILVVGILLLTFSLSVLGAQTNNFTEFAILNNVSIEIGKNYNLKPINDITVPFFDNATNIWFRNAIKEICEKNKNNGVALLSFIAADDKAYRGAIYNGPLYFTILYVKNVGFFWITE
jgi:late competence protein required for DNA uptake (superfamily II DNA/RNA helicase)